MTEYIINLFNPPYTVTTSISKVIPDNECEIKGTSHLILYNELHSNIGHLLTKLETR